MTTKKNPWFRFYSDFMFDEKIEFLAFEDQRHYVLILCMKNFGLIDKEYTQPGMLDRVVSKRLGLYGEAFESAKKRLVDAGLIDYKFQPIAWDKRQFLSDSSTERVQAYRERTKQVKRSGNVSETAQEADTDTDTDKEKKSASAPTLDISPALLADYLTVRKAKHAGALTRTAIAGIQREAAKAGVTLTQAVTACCEFGWQGFRADWYTERTTSKPAAMTANNSETAYQRSMRLRVAEVSPLLARAAPGEAPKANVTDFFRTVEAATNVKTIGVTK